MRWCFINFSIVVVALFYSLFSVVSFSNWLSLFGKLDDIRGYYKELVLYKMKIYLNFFFFKL